MTGNEPQTDLSVTAEAARTQVETIYRAESRRVFATLVRLVGKFDVAEEALHDAFHTALELWPRDLRARQTSILCVERRADIQIHGIHIAGCEL